MDADDVFQWVAGVVVVVIIIAVLAAGGKSLYRYLWPVRDNVQSVVEQLQTDIDTINKKNTSWQIQEADVEIFFSAKASGKDTAGNDKSVLSVTSESGTESSNKLTIRLRHSAFAATAPDNLVGPK